MEMTCPKCHGEMRHYERSGVTVDQCSDCRGIFLDRGELERLIDAETAWQAARGGPAPARQEPRYEQPRYDDRRHDDHDRRHDDHDYRKRKKKESFFEQLFD
jgi:Zn-finger nucleic acid-binding protein